MKRALARRLQLRKARLEAKDDPKRILGLDKATRPVQLRPAGVRQSEKTEAKRKLYVLHSLPQFVRNYLGWDMMPFHKEVMRRLFRISIAEAEEWWGFRWSRYRPDLVEDPETRAQQVVLLPSEHAKSTYGCIVFPIASLANDPNGAHIISCTNVREASARVSTVAAILKDPKYHALISDYPWLKQSYGKKWTASQITIAGREDSTNINPSLVGLGRGAKDIKSRRGKHVMDDLEGTDSMRSGERDGLYQWVTLEAIRALEDEALQPRPLAAMLGTPFDVDSIYFRMRKSGFQEFRQPHRYPKSKPEQKVGSLIWPLKENKIKEFRRILTSPQFAVIMKLDPTGGDKTQLSVEQLGELSTAHKSMFDADHVDYFSFVFLDPASGSRNRGVDYAGIGHIKIRWLLEEEFPWVEVYQPIAFTGGMIPQVNLCASLVAKWQCPVIFETNGPQAMTYKTLFQIHAKEVVLQPFHTSDKKKWDERMGLAVLQDLMGAGRIKVFGTAAEADDEDWDLEDPSDSAGIEDDPHVHRFLSEVRDLKDPQAHNHIAAGVWFGIRHAYENRRRGASQPAPTGPQAPKLRFGSGYGRSTVISLRPEKDAAERAERKRHSPFWDKEKTYVG